ncbi:MAG: hypothetical protein J6K89_09845 [Oscillospiraceae bacterium]|nr:hypothetical protein [Oscillospiraceae bacterium]
MKFILKRSLCVLLILSLLMGMLPGIAAEQRNGASETREAATGTGSSFAEKREALKQQINSLEPSAPINEFYDTTKSVSGGYLVVDGSFFIVNVLTYNGDQYAYVLDPTMPALYGKMQALPVVLMEPGETGLPVEGSYIMGLEDDAPVCEGMALEFVHSTTMAAKYHTLELGGPYAEEERDFYLYGKVYDDDPSTAVVPKMSVYPARVTASTPGPFTVALDNRTVKQGDIRVSFTHTGPMALATGSPDYFHYLALNTADPTKEVYYELNTNDSDKAGSQTPFKDYYNVSGRATFEQVSSFLFRRLEDRADTSRLRMALVSKNMENTLSWDPRYDVDTYEEFLQAVEQALALYDQYNGASLSAAQLSNARTAIEQSIRSMMDLSSVLTINTQGGDLGTDVYSFSANMFLWNEAEMNRLTLEAEQAAKAAAEKAGKTYTYNGFYFTGTPGDTNRAKYYPVFSRWNDATGMRELLHNGVENVAVEAQSYGIYSGLASETLSSSGSPLKNSTTVTDVGFWEPSDRKVNGVDVRKFYSDVQLPFKYDRETGYYTLDSNTNAVFFPDEPADGVSLEISDKPAVFISGGGGVGTAADPSTFVTGKLSTYGVYDAYVTGFQPFSKLTDRKWAGFTTSVPFDITAGRETVDGYLISGVPEVDYDNRLGEMGRAIYGFGMAMTVPFRLSQDGKVNGENITFTFGGDDDVWVYVDGKLALDIGGSHGAIQGSINFATGTVEVWCEKYDRIIDLSGNYGRDTGLYNCSRSDGTYGTSLDWEGTNVSVIGMKDGSTPARLYQENLYTGLCNGVSATEEQVAEFANEGSHTLQIFYMDRGQNQTNCYISFNMPQPDKLVVEKEIYETYGQMADGSLTHTTEPLAPQWMESLEGESYSFRLLENGEPAANVPYWIMEGDYRVAVGSTDENGTFTMTAKQQVHFQGLDMTTDKHYSVEELISGNWGAPAYTYRYEAGGTTVDGQGNGYTPTVGEPYVPETLTIRCTNTWCGAELEGQPQKVVLDYGKPIDIEVVRNAVVNGASEVIVREAELLYAALSEEDRAYGEISAYLDLNKDVMGNTDGRADSFRFTPMKMLDRVLPIRCTILLTFETGEQRQVEIPVYVMPATVMYYETDFLREQAEELSLEVVGSKAESQPWATEGTSQQEVQDNGYVTDQLDDFVIHKESIPSNAFFADFDGDTARYLSDPIYDGLDLDTAEDWSYQDQHMSKPKIDTALGTLTMEMKATGSGIRPYIQTGNELLRDYHLNFHPGEDYYAQARFKLEDLKLENVNATSHFMIHYYTGPDKYSLENVNQGSNADTILKDLGSVRIPEEAFTSGEYVTVSFKLNQIPYTRITALRFFFSNVTGKSETELGKVTVDYFYIGPLTDKGSEHGQDLNGDVRQELFFDFDNSMQAQQRYQQSQYNLNLKGVAAYRNMDTVKPRSTAADSVEGTWWTSQNNASEITINNQKGTLSMDVTNSTNSAATRPYGPYLGTTSLHHTVAWANTESVPYHSLDFTPQGETWFYIRFKLAGCAEDTAHSKEDPLGNNKLYVQFSVIDENGKGYYAYPNYTFKNGEYITVACDVTDKVNQCLAVSSIRSLYFRFTHLKQSGSAKGSVEIDYIYVGPKKAAANTHEEIVSAIRSPEARNVYVDFTNSYNDQYRYSSQLYGGKNFDLVGTWPSKSFFTKSVEDGALKLTATQALIDKEDGWGDLCSPSGSPVQSPLQYYLSGDNDILRFRAKLVGASQKGSYESCIGFGIGWTEGNVVFGDIPRYAFAIEPEEIVGQWREYTIELGDDYANQSNKITHIYPYVNGLQFVEDGYLLIDYIYIGPADEFEAPVADPQENAVLIHFDNTDGDKKRYASTLYSGVNYDLASNWDNYHFDFSVEKNSMKLSPKSTYSSASNYGSMYPQYDKTKPTAALNYRMTGNDHFQMRFKFVNAQGISSTAARVEIVFGPDLYPYTSTSNAWAPKPYNANLVKWELNEEQVTGGAWITVDADLADHNWVDGPIDLIRFLIPRFQHIQFNSGGYILIDYIYLGPVVEGRPVSDSLFFGFDDMQTDAERYSSDAYGGYNYDAYDPANRIGYWATHPDYHEDRNKAAYEIVPDNGTLSLDVSNVSPTNADVIGPWMISTSTSDIYNFALSYRTFSYVPENAEYMQIRFRLNNCLLKEGKESCFVFCYGGYDKNGTYGTYFDNRTMYTVTNGQYQIAVISLNDGFRSMGKITNVGLRFQNIYSTAGGSVDIDYIYVGPGELAPDPVYGYDSSYTDDATLSNGSSWVVEGSGVKLNETTSDYTQAQFSFRGTGFDIISRTGMEQGAIRVEVKRKDAPASEDPVKTLTVNNKGELELYQIPVVSVEGLSYGEYTVTLWVNKAVSTGISFLDRGGQFYLDAVRIYEPMGTDYDVNSLIAEAYKSDKEAYPHIKEIRNILLSADNFAQLVTAGEGAIFVDAHNAPEATVPATDNNGETTNETVTVTPPGIQISEHYVADVQTYNKVGPKNEVYLAPGQAVAFRLDISTSYMPTSVDVGVKNIAPDETGKFAVGVVSKDSTAQDLQITYRREIPVGSATSQYYALELSSDALFTETVEGKPYRYCYIVLYNDSTAKISHEDGAGEGKHILSVTDMKLAYAQTPEVGLPKDQITDPEIPVLPQGEGDGKRSAGTFFDFKVDDRTLEAAALFMKAVLETPVLVEDTDLMHSLNLASDIALNYAIRKEKLADYDSFCLECVIPVYRDGIPVAEETVSIDPVERDGLYYFTLEGLTAVQMNDVIHATLRMEKAGRSYYSETDRYSIAQYAYTQLGKTGISPQLQTLCAELLRYGSAAQSFKGYRTAALADGAMTEEQRALLSDLTEVSFGSHNRQLGELSEPTIGWKGKALLLDSKVTLRYVIDTTGYTGRIQDLSLRVSYEDHSGEEKTVLLTDPKVYGSGAGLYSFDFDSLLAAELRTVLYAAVYAGDTQLSDTLEYSVDTYGNNKTGTLGTLCRALMAYSDSAKAFFAK